MATNKYSKLNIVSDEIQNRKRIAFGFDAYASAFAEMIATKENQTPFTIGISGKWGSGKTTLMREIERKLQKDLLGEGFRKIKTIWFNAWKYKDEDQVLAAMIDEIIKGIENDSSVKEKIKETGIKEIKKQWKRLDLFKLISAVGKVTTGMDIKDYLDFKEEDGDKPLDEKYKEFLSFYDIFNKHFDELIATYLGVKVDKKSNAINDQEAALVIFIDDLDRCPLPKIIQTLETIKVFLDKKGCIFVIGAAKDIIKYALEKDKSYEAKDIERFLEKIIQIDFSLPKKTIDNSMAFMNEIKEQLNLKDKLSDAIIEVILPILKFNPRRIIALFNRISLQQAILKHSNNDIDFEKMLYWRVLEIYNSDFVNYIIDEKRNYDSFIKDMKSFNKLNETDKNDDEAIKKANIIDKHLPYLKDEKIIKLIKDLALSADKYESLVSYSKTFEEEIALPESEEEILEWIIKQEEEAKVQRQIDYKDFINIDGGEYNLERIGKTNITSFAISKYPVTNAWYREFVEAGGYEKFDYLGTSNEDKEIKEFLQGLNEKKPAYWDDTRFNQDYQPVVGISWYEAKAFCKWLSKKQKIKYYLPTGQEWQAAAGGKEAKKYPWGDQWDKLKCNNEELSLKRTTIVDIFKNGTSDAGVMDMAGNVWEWTGTVDRPFRVLRGGSWDFSSDSFRVANHASGDPRGRNGGIGFRLAHSL